MTKKVYITIYNIHRIFICDSQTGKVLYKWGIWKESVIQGNFNVPMGLTVDNDYAYICDQFNHRVQLITKYRGAFHRQWGDGYQSTEMGQFYYPTSIYYNNGYDHFLYIGDRYSVQIFTKFGICLQRLGDQVTSYHTINGLCVMDHRLYVSDVKNKRIVVYKIDPKDIIRYK